MREYELMYILDPTLDEDGTQSLIGQIEDFAKKQGVSLESTDPWGKRRLAYRIGRHWDGYYVLSRLRAESKMLAEMERRLRVTDGVLRFMTVRVDTDLAKLERQRARKAAREDARRQRKARAAAAKEKAAESRRASTTAEPEAPATAESAPAQEES